MSAKTRQQFFVCKHCGNIVGMVFNAGVSVVCCGEKMQEMEPNTVDAAHEKHLPVIDSVGERRIVNVGEVDHPMAAEHFIEWIYVETERGGQRKCLSPGEKPNLTFIMDDDKPIAVYSYCNLHGLWKTEL